MGLGYVEGLTHDYVRHGTTTLCAALDIANGQVLTQNKSRLRHQEFFGFLRHLVKIGRAPPGFEAESLKKTTPLSCRPSIGAVCIRHGDRN
jgi:hypothetical protein